MKVKVLNIRLTKEHFDKDQEKVNQFLKTVKMRKSSTQLVEDKVNYWSILFYYSEIESQENKKSKVERIEVSEGDLNSDQKEIYSALKEWRNSIAEEKKLPAFTILHNQTLIDIVYKKVETVEELEKIRGIGSSKIAQYGNAIIAVLNAF
jgi:superfamily II DNA helicase RecQ